MACATFSMADMPPPTPCGMAPVPRTLLPQAAGGAFASDSFASPSVGLASPTWASFLGSGEAPQPLADAAAARPTRKRTRVVIPDMMADDDDGDDDDEGLLHEAQSGAGPKKYRGVWLDKKRNKFKTRIWVSGRTLFLGSHTSEDEAARAYDQVAISRGGRTAFTNFPTADYDCESLMATPLPELVAELRGQASRTRVEMQTSRHRGVCRHKQSGKWSARIQDRGRKIFIGLFDTEAEAAEAFDEQASHLSRQRHGFDGLEDFPRTPRTPRRAVSAAVAHHGHSSPESGVCADSAWEAPHEAADMGTFIRAPKKPRSPSSTANGSVGNSKRGSMTPEAPAAWHAPCAAGAADALVVQAARTLLRMCAAAACA